MPACGCHRPSALHIRSQFNLEPRTPADAVALLPPDAYSRLLRHTPPAGELYSILGLSPASPASLVAQLLLPRLGALPGPAAAQLLGFVAEEWGRMKVGALAGAVLMVRRPFRCAMCMHRPSRCCCRLQHMGKN